MTILNALVSFFSFSYLFWNKCRRTRFMSKKLFDRPARSTGKTKNVDFLSNVMLIVEIFSQIAALKSTVFLEHLNLVGGNFSCWFQICIFQFFLGWINFSIRKNTCQLSGHITKKKKQINSVARSKLKNLLFLFNAQAPINQDQFTTVWFEKCMAF